MPTSDQETSDQGEKERFRRCTFTQFINPDVGPAFNDKKLAYLAYAKEICPSDGNVHWQGFAYSKLLMSHKVWRKLWTGAHIERMTSDFKTNEKYCSKEG
jgi:hypothetical protein